MNDKQRLVHEAMVKVLDEFDVVWEDSRTKRHQAIEFVVDGRRYMQTWTAGDPRSANNAKSQFRNRLKQLGAPLREYQPESESSISEEPLIESIAQAALDPEPPSPAANEDMPEPVQSAVPANEADAEPTVRTLTVESNLNGDGRHRVFRSTRVIAIELRDDLIIAKGNILVVPLSQPDQMMDLRPDQFRALFKELSVLQTDHTATRATRMSQPAVPSAPVAQTVPRMPIRPPIPRPLPPKLQRPVEPPKTQRTHRPRPAEMPSRRNGVIQPQLGRLLAALMYALDSTQTEFIQPQLVTPYLDARDARQLAARMPNAVERHLAVREEALPPYRGWLYSITPEGRHIVREAGTWPFTCEGITPPIWLEQLLAE